MICYFFSNTNKNNYKYVFNVYETEGLAYKTARTKDQGKKINKFFYVLNSSLDQQHEAHSEINHGVISKSDRLTISPLVRKTYIYSPALSISAVSLLLSYTDTHFFTLKIMSIIRIKAALKGSVLDRTLYIPTPGLLSGFPVSMG